MAIEKQELHCHNCDKYVHFDIDPEKNGKYEIECPNCKHMHCRVINNGRITDERWDSRNGNYIKLYSTCTSTSHITFQYANATCTSTDLSMFFQQSWANSTCYPN